MIKLIASDLDGTLVNSQKNFAPDFYKILKQLKKQGIEFVIASGRSQYGIAKKLKYCTKDITYISDNGGYIKGKNIEKIILPLSKEQSLSTVEECLAIPEAQVIMCAKNISYFISPNLKYIPEITKYYTDYKIIDDYKKVEEQILKIAVYDPISAKENSYKQVNDKLNKELRAVVSSYDWMDIMNKNLNKGYALKILQTHLGITKDETMVFGDFNNDIEMLKEAKYSYAMENSNDEVKKAANFVAPSNDNFGVAKIIKQEVLKEGVHV